MPAHVLDLDAKEPFGSITGLLHPEAVVLLRSRGAPIGTLRVPCPDGRLDEADLRRAIAATPGLAARLRRRSLERWLLHQVPGPAPDPTPPTWSLVICTRDRPDDLARCLGSLRRLATARGGEVIVVDNASVTQHTARVVADHPGVRYTREDRPGLNWARAHGARLATGEIVLYTDDDVVVDPGWVDALLAPFAEPRVAAVTGLTLPLELETEAQELFERYGGLGRGFEPRTFDFTVLRPASAGQVGAGANMAIRRRLVTELGLFETELDCGTAAATGGDTYAFYRLLAGGHRVVYSPAALVWHRHRREREALARTLQGYSTGGFAVLLRCWLEHGDWEAPLVGLTWLWKDHVRKLARALLRRPGHLPLALLLRYCWGVALAPAAYRRSRRRERALRQAGAEAARPLEHAA